jgi:hypothetical protein
VLRICASPMPVVPSPKAQTPPPCPPGSARSSCAHWLMLPRGERAGDRRSTRGPGRSGTPSKPGSPASSPSRTRPTRVMFTCHERPSWGRSGAARGKRTDDGHRVHHQVAEGRADRAVGGSTALPRPVRGLRPPPNVIVLRASCVANVLLDMVDQCTTAPPINRGQSIGVSRGRTGV